MLLRLWRRRGRRRRWRSWTTLSCHLRLLVPGWSQGRCMLPGSADARMAGLSWGKLGRVLGVSKQLLHAASADPRCQQFLELSGVANGVAAEIVVEVDEHPPPLGVPFGDLDGPLAQLVVGV